MYQIVRSSSFFGTSVGQMLFFGGIKTDEQKLLKQVKSFLFDFFFLESPPCFAIPPPCLETHITFKLCPSRKKRGKGLHGRLNWTENVGLNGDKEPLGWELKISSIHTELVHGLYTRCTSQGRVSHPIDINKTLEPKPAVMTTAPTAAIIT